MGLLDTIKNLIPGGKKISRQSANFARLVKSLCADSGIPIPLQLQVTKAIARDYVDNKSRNLSHFIFMEHTGAVAYLKAAGMTDMDAEIFLNILQTNRDSFLAI